MIQPPFYKWIWLRAFSSSALNIAQLADPQDVVVISDNGICSSSPRYWKVGKWYLSAQKAAENFQFQHSGFSSYSSDILVRQRNKPTATQDAIKLYYSVSNNCKDTKQYFQFLQQDSAFFPTTWKSWCHIFLDSSKTYEVARSGTYKNRYDENIEYNIVENHSFPSRWEITMDEGQQDRCYPICLVLSNRKAKRPQTLFIW